MVFNTVLVEREDRYYFLAIQMESCERSDEKASLPFNGYVLMRPSQDIRCLGTASDQSSER